jgi:hypothetical protein
MTKLKVSPVTAPAADASEPVSKGVATKFSQWLILVSTQALWELEDRSNASVDLYHRGVLLGKLVLRKENKVIVAQAWFNDGGKILYSGVEKNHNFREHKETGGVSLLEQAQNLELMRAVRRWNDIDRCCEGLV